jgi:C1A family cysteine protease
MSEQPVIRKYGWKKGVPDPADVFHMKVVAPPKETHVDLRQYCPPVYDQGSLGSCTANAIGAAYQFDQIKGKVNTFVPSRLFIYYNERVLEGTVKEDAGASIKDSARTINITGVCNEISWPYDIKKFAQKPPKPCYTDALQHKSVVYKGVAQTLNDLKTCLANGFPFVFGFVVYPSFETVAVSKTGLVPMPTPTEQPLGGHAVMACGYDDSKSVFIVRNSWSSRWGDKGYFYMPYAYITNSNLASDFWTVTSIMDTNVKK